VISWEVVNTYIQRVYDRENLSFTKMLDGREIYFLQDDMKNNQEYYQSSRWINLPGVLIRRNVLVALSGLATFCGFDMDDMLNKAGTFPGTQRRFEKLSSNLYSDYGHHPAEIFATLQKAGEIINENYESKKETLEGKLLQKSGNLNKQKLILVYQPHQNIRQHDPEIQLGYRHCFINTEQVYWLPTYLSREFGELPILSPQQIIETSQIPSRDIFEIQKLDKDLADKIKKHLAKGDMVIIMGAGDIDSWARVELV
jgi:UDP-N-acetylmuramate--alanine ligase